MTDPLDPLAHVRHLLGAADTDLIALLEYVEAHCAARGVQIQIRPATDLVIPATFADEPHGVAERRRGIWRWVLVHAVGRMSQELTEREVNSLEGSATDIAYASMLARETVKLEVAMLRQWRDQDLRELALAPGEITEAQQFLDECERTAAHEVQGHSTGTAALAALMRSEAGATSTSEEVPASDPRRCVPERATTPPDGHLEAAARDLVRGNTGPWHVVVDPRPGRGSATLRAPQPLELPIDAEGDPTGLVVFEAGDDRDLGLGYVTAWTSEGERASLELDLTLYGRVRLTEGGPLPGVRFEWRRGR